MKEIDILIVEDELLIAENLATKLERLNYNILDIVSSGKAAIKKVTAEKPDLILMDIAIKGSIDGITTAENIRKDNDIPVIFLTAYADDDTLDRASKIGGYGYILKPFKDRELHATIKMALSKHQEQSKIQQSLQAKIDAYADRCSPANIDSLTLLPNHLALADLFEYILSGIDSDRENQNLIAVLYLEIDRFTKLLKFLSHEDREATIKSISEKLKLSLAKYEDANVIIKLQNSEFVILVSEVGCKTKVENIAKEILFKIYEPLVIDKVELFLTASIGVAFYPSDRTEIDGLLQHAKQALQYAQETGGNRYKFYSSSLKLISSNSDRNLLLETDLHYALERRELELYYQPKIELQTGKIAGAEALIRWNHSKLGLIMPNRFIPIAEESSLIESIGEWILATACGQARIWHELGFKDFQIAVNLSGRQFKQLNLFHKLTQILFDSSLKSEFLELELTEKILIDNEKLNIQRLNLLRKSNIKISLDDFGTGYSSLSYLKQFPFDFLKIDRSFISKIEQNSKNAVITKSIIEMAHKLNLKVVAEGVETQAELDFLLDCQCDYAQGYFFSTPLCTKEFQRLLTSKKLFNLN